MALGSRVSGTQAIQGLQDERECLQTSRHNSGDKEEKNADESQSGMTDDELLTESGS